VNPVLAEKLAGDDTTLFNQGACHVFADELYSWLAIKGFAFRRLADESIKSSPQGKALHVYLARGDRLIDVNGLQMERDLIQRRHDERSRSGWVPNLQAIECTHEELFTPFPRLDDPKCGVRNQWGLDLEVEFVEACRKRASQLISCRSEIYIPRG
jgi:hypothetical protein